MDEKHIPGLTLAVIKNGQVIKKSSYGVSNIEYNIPVTDNTVFEIASMTKQITCAAILLLQEDGKLSVHDLLSKYLSNLPLTWRDITLEQLMNHTSGLRDDWDEPTSYFFRNNTDEKMLDAQKQMPLFFKPGEGFNYSSGPFFLGLVIEKITGRNYSYFLKDRIFKPLEMSSTCVYDSTSLTNNLATGYHWNNNKYEIGIDIPSAAEARADVGILTTIDDMIKWNNALNDNNFLKVESKQAMFTAGKLKTGIVIPYGYGWYIYYYRNKVLFEHGGAFRTGFNSRITKIPETGLDIIVLCNKWKSDLSDLTYQLASYYDKTFKKISEVKKEKSKADYKTKGIENLFHDLSIKKYNRGQLYQQINISGFDPDELEDLLRGFKKTVLLGKVFLKSNPRQLFGTSITEVFYYKIEADKPSYWSFAYNANGKLICANLED